MRVDDPRREGKNQEALEQAVVEALKWITPYNAAPAEWLELVVYEKPLPE